MKQHAIERPMEFEDERDHEGSLLTIEMPNELVIRAENYMRPQSFVVDIGADQGQDALLLAEFGHEVHLIEPHHGRLRDAYLAHSKLGELAAPCYFDDSDMNRAELCEEIYDAAIGIDALHKIIGRHPRDVIKIMQRAVKPGGLNIVRTPVATQREQIFLTEFNYFEPAELQRLYVDTGWEVLETNSDYRPAELTDTGLRCISADEIIAQKAPAP